MTETTQSVPIKPNTKLKLVTVEPLLCIIALSFQIMNPPRKHLQLDLACRVNAGFNETVCNLITEDHKNALETLKNQTKIVDDYVSGIKLWSTPAYYGISAITLTLWGAYSDKYKIIRPFFSLLFIARSIECVGSVVCIKYKNLCSIQLQGILQHVVSQLFGGHKILFMATYIYINNISTPETRTIRFSVLYIFIQIWRFGAFTYNLNLYDTIDAIGSYLTALAFLLSGLFYGMYIVADSTQQVKRKNTTKRMILDAFNPHHIIDTLKVLVKYNKGLRNGVIFILCIEFINIITFDDQNQPFYSLMKSKFKLDYPGPFYAIKHLEIIIGLGLGVAILKGFFKLHDLMIIALAFSGKILFNIILLTTSSTCGAYLSSLVDMLHKSTYPVVNSQALNYVSKDDVGKMLCLVILINNIGQVIKEKLYTKTVWGVTPKYNSGAFLLVAIVLLTPGVFALTWKYLKDKKSSAGSTVASIT